MILACNGYPMMTSTTGPRRTLALRSRPTTGFTIQHGGFEKWKKKTFQAGCRMMPLAFRTLTVGHALAHSSLEDEIAQHERDSFDGYVARSLPRGLVES